MNIKTCPRYDNNNIPFNASRIMYMSSRGNTIHILHGCKLVGSINNIIPYKIYAKSSSDLRKEDNKIYFIVADFNDIFYTGIKGTWSDDIIKNLILDATEINKSAIEVDDARTILEMLLL